MDMIERVLKMWNEGCTEREIAAKFDVPVHTIEMILAQQKVYEYAYHGYI